MNKKIFILWFLIIIGLILTILVIGLKDKDFKYIKFEYNLKIAASMYMKDNNIEPKINESTVIFSNDLDSYISNEDLDNYCIKNIVYYNGLIFNKYEINKNCEE